MFKWQGMGKLNLSYVLLLGGFGGLQRHRHNFVWLLRLDGVGLKRTPNVLHLLD